MITNAHKNDRHVGLDPNLIEKGAVVLHYVDEIVICHEHGLDKFSNP